MQKMLYLARLVVWPSVIQFLTQLLNMDHSFQVKNLIVIVQRPVNWTYPFSAGCAFTDSGGLNLSIAAQGN